MLGLIKKDLLMAKGNLRTIAVIFVVFLVVAINGNENFSFLPAFMSVMIMMSTFSYDEYNKSNPYIATFPNGKVNAVRAKYIATLLIVFVSVILSMIISIAVGYAKNNSNIEEILSVALGTGGSVIILQSILYPFIYKFGIEKSRIGIFLVVFGITGIASIFFKQGMMINMPENIVSIFSNYWMIIIPIIIALILLISYKASKAICLKKEF